MKIATTLLWMLAAGTGSPLHAQNNNQLFERALVKERAEGDLAGAIKLYQQILKTKSPDRGLLARTLIQLAQCYEKQGNQEARKLYDRVVKEFSDQRTFAELARERIAALGANPPASAGITLRQVWSPAIDVWGSPTPDGRLLSFVDWETGDLAIRDLTTGQNRRLMNHGPWATREVEAEGNKISPDGKQVVYAWNKWKDPNPYELRLIQTDGTGDRLLYRHEKGAYVEPYDWMPDGKSIIAELLPEVKLGTYQLVRIGLGGSVQVLHTLQARRSGRAFVSPDGHWLAYSAPSSPNNLRSRDIYLLDLQNPSPERREMPLVVHPANDRLLGWSPDGRSILFRSDRGASQSLWVLPLLNGKPNGEPTLVKAEVGELEPMGVLRNGTILAVLKQATNDAMEAGFDIATGKPTLPLTRLSNRLVGATVGPQWSPNGRRLLLGSRAQGARLEVRDSETGTETTVGSKFHPQGGWRWHPDGESILAEGTSLDGKYAGIFRIGIDDSAPKLLVPRKPGWAIVQFEASHDGKTIYYKTDHVTLTARNLDTATEQVVYRGKEDGPAIMDLAVSPDGRQLAILLFDSLGLLDIGTGAWTEKAKRVNEGGPFRSVAWTPDGRNLLLVAGNELRQIPVNGGPVITTKLPNEIRSLSMHPDGRRLAVTVSNSWTEIWALENVLPQVAQR